MVDYIECDRTHRRLGLVIEVAPIGLTGKIAAFVAQAIGYLPETAVTYIAAAAAAGLAEAAASRPAVDFGP